MSFSALESGESSSELFAWIGTASLAIEVLAITLIIGAVFAGTARYLYFLLWKRTATNTHYLDYRQGVARWLLLGLEILVAGDVIRTVALTPTLESIAALGLLVLVRTFLSWALEVEINGRWPWQKGRNNDQLS